MKRIITYIPSLIISVLLVFVFLITSLVSVVFINFRSEKCIELVHANDIGSKILSETEKYYKTRYNTTGIPAEVYTSALDEDYIYSVTEEYIKKGFEYVLDQNSEKVQSFRVYFPWEDDYSESIGKVLIPKNERLEKNIEDFYNDYAESIGYEKDELFEKKLSNAKSEAYKVISGYCDVYKISALGSHGVLRKIQTVYGQGKPLMYVTALTALSVILLLILFLVNIKEKKPFMYWFGISAIISGIFGIVPCIWLLSENYFSRFSIKQASVFTSFTSSFRNFTEAFLAVQIACTALGIALVIIYAIVSGKDKSVKPTDI